MIQTSISERKAPSYEIAAVQKGLSGLNCSPLRLKKNRIPWLKKLRDEKGISQRQLARKMGVSRGYFQRLESKKWEDMLLKDLELLSKGLDVPVPDLLEKLRIMNPSGAALVRTSLEKPFQVFETAEGFRYGTYLRQPKGCQVGMLTLEPKKRISKKQFLKNSSIAFGLVQEGTLLLTLSGREYCLKKNECFSFEEIAAFEIHNPHQFQKAVVLFFSSDCENFNIV